MGLEFRTSMGITGICRNHEGFWGSFFELYHLGVLLQELQYLQQFRIRYMTLNEAGHEQTS